MCLTSVSARNVKLFTLFVSIWLVNYANLNPSTFHVVWHVNELHCRIWSTNLNLNIQTIRYVSWMHVSHFNSMMLHIVG